MLLYGKNLLLQNHKKSLMIFNMQHQEIKLYKVYINDDPGLTMDYFTASKISNCAYTRLGCQVSVYRTIGPLVILLDCLLRINGLLVHKPRILLSLFVMSCILSH